MIDTNVKYFLQTKSKYDVDSSWVGSIFHKEGIDTLRQALGEVGKLKTLIDSGFQYRIVKETVIREVVT